MCRDLDRAAEFDQSQLFRKIYEEEFGIPGGEPYGLLVIDHEVRHRSGPRARRPTTSSALRLLAGVAAAAFVPDHASARVAGVAGGRRLRRPRQRRRHRHAVPRRRTRPLAQPGVARGHALPRASACRACWRARRGATIPPARDGFRYTRIRARSRPTASG